MSSKPSTPPVQPVQNENSLQGLGLRKLGENIGITLVRQLIGTVTGTLSILLLARILEPEGYGLYSVIILLPSFLIVLASIGLPTANIYFISRKSVSLKGALQTSVRIWLALSLTVSLLVAIVISIWGDSLFPGVPSEYLFLGLLAFPLNLLHTFLISILHGLQDFRRLNTIQAVIPTVTLGLIVILVGVLQLGLAGALLVFIIGHTVAILLYLVNLQPHLKHEQQTAENNSEGYWKQSLGYGWKAALSNIITFINYRVDIYIVNLYLNPAALGVYALAVRIGEQLGLLSGAVSSVLLPRVSELHTDENRQRMLTPIAARWTLYLTGTLAVGVLIVGRLVIAILGADYTDSFNALVLLLPGIVSLSLSRVLANDIAARGRPDLNVYTSLITIVVEVPAIFILIQKFGVTGAALASTIAYSAQAITSLAFYRRLSRNPWWLPVIPNRSDVTILKAGLVMLQKRMQ